MPVPASWTAFLDGVDDARRDADRILERPEYQPSKVPRPFQGVARWLGERLEPVAELFNDLLTNPAAGSIALGLVALVVAGAAAVAVQRRNKTAGASVARHRERAADPDELERLSDEAERAGDLEQALRLRFRAGLLRLDRSGVASHPEGTPSGQLARQLRVPAFSELAATFDEVVYGRRRASAEDVARARAGWPVVMREVNR